ncbi:MAG: hypothetical protein AB7Q00_08715 [Phycisphaerales bacterium]
MRNNHIPIKKAILAATLAGVGIALLFMTRPILDRELSSMESVILGACSGILIRDAIGIAVGSRSKG